MKQENVKQTDVKKFVKINVKDSGSSLMQCGGGNLCNETK